VENFNWVALITALGGFGAAALFVREIVNIITLMRKGVAAKESRRSNDIIAQRDAAIAERDAANARATEAEKRTDRERENRRRLEWYAARLHRDLVMVGASPDPWPEIDETTEITKT
jgi:hypothetical protein